MLGGCFLERLITFFLLNFFKELIESIEVDQTKKTGITAIDPDMLNQKEKKQLRYPGLKAGLVYGILMFFGMPLLNVLTDDNKNYFTSLFNLGHFTSILFAAFFFGLMMQLVFWLRIRKAKEDQDDY